MNNQPLSEKELEIINVIADGFRSNQRELSIHIGASLGMTNLLLRRLVTKGYLRIKQLTAKKMHYLLTPRGLSEKARKSLHYTRKTIESFGIIKEEIRRLLTTNLNDQIKEIYVIGEGDLADLVGMIIRDLERHYSVKRTIERPAQTSERLVIDASYELPLASDDGTNHINIMNLLSQTLSFRNNQSPPRTMT